MSNLSTRRKARDIALDLLTDVNDRQNHRFFRHMFDLEDEVDFQVCDDLIDALHDHGAPVVSHATRTFLRENNGRQKVMTEVTFICRIIHEKPKETSTN